MGVGAGVKVGVGHRLGGVHLVAVGMESPFGADDGQRQRTEPGDETAQGSGREAALDDPFEPALAAPPAPRAYPALGSRRSHDSEDYVSFETKNVNVLPSAPSSEPAASYRRLAATASPPFSARIPAAEGTATSPLPTISSFQPSASVPFRLRWPARK